MSQKPNYLVITTDPDGTITDECFCPDHFESIRDLLPQFNNTVRRTDFECDTCPQFCCIFTDCIHRDIG